MDEQEEKQRRRKEEKVVFHGLFPLAAKKTEPRTGKTASRARKTKQVVKRAAIKTE